MSRNPFPWSTGIAEPRWLLLHYLRWAEPTFSDGCIMLTVALLRAEAPYRLLGTCFDTLDLNVLLRRPPGYIPRFPVLARMEGFPHVHCLFKPVPYVNERRGIYSLEELIRQEFEHRLSRVGDVHVQTTSGGPGPLIYELLEQGDVEVLIPLMKP